MPPRAKKVEEVEEIEEEEVVEESSLRDDIESAIEEHEDEGPEGTDETENETEEEAAGEETEETGEESTTEAGKTIGDAEVNEAGYNAPIGFNAEAREQWKNVPDKVKAEIHRRDQEVSETIAGTNEARKTHSHLTDLAKSYAPIMAAEGARTPMEAIEGLFRTVSELRVSSPQARAKKMAALIGHYGVDITMLDAALSGSAMPNPEQDSMAQMIDQRMAPVNEFLATQRQQGEAQQAQNTTAINTELAEFSKSAEFLQDVRMDMADLIELASKRDYKMGFKEAYTKACAMHPTVSKVIAERATSDALKNNGKKKAGKRNASSALSSSSADTIKGEGAGDSLRDTLNRNWDELTE